MWYVNTLKTDFMGFPTRLGIFNTKQEAEAFAAKQTVPCYITKVHTYA